MSCVFEKYLGNCAGKKLLREYSIYFTASHVFQPEQEALWILQNIFGKDFLLHEKILVDSSAILKMKTIIHDRIVLQKPLAYILGCIPFLNLEILCQAPILIPRVETEEWVLELINVLSTQYKADEQFTILDLCTGSGCIALALASHFPQAKVIGIDIDPVAVDLSKKNAVYNQIKNVEFKMSDLFENIELTEIDLIVSNPPYITKDKYNTLEPSVKHWESRLSLVADDDGLEFYKKIIFKTFELFSRKKGKADNIVYLALEMDPWQILEVQKLLDVKVFSTKIFTDMFDNQRSLFAFLK